jgi:hypothetical protein
MAQPLRREIIVDVPDRRARISIRAHGPAYQAYLLLYAACIPAPLVAGFDKFFGVLVPGTTTLRR